MTRILPSVALLVTCAAFLAGCVVFRSASAAPEGPFGMVRFSAVVCASGYSNAASEPCNDYGRTSGNVENRSDTRVLMGFLVPAGTRGPGSFDGTPDSGAANLLFAPSAAYTAKLQEWHPAPAGFEWLGYGSNQFDSGGTAKQFSASADFAVPQGADGAPFAGPFKAQIVVGAAPSGGNPAGCDGYCVDSVRPGDNTTVPGSLASVFSVPVNDAGILGGPAVTAARGSTATVPFTLAYNGSDPGADLTFTTSTDLPGATPSGPTTARPTGTSQTPLTVSVPVPAGAAPGSYAVKLTATLGGQTRTQTRTLVVTGAPESSERPEISGSQQEGSVLTGSDGTWTGAPSLSRRWLRCDAAGAAGADIPGATSATYRLGGADLGRTLRLRVTATNAGGTAERDSAPTGTIVALPPVPAPIPPDTTAPKLTLSGLPKTVRRKALLRGLTFTVARDEAAALSAAMLGTARKVTLARASAFEVILGSARAARATGAATLTLRPAKKLVGRARRFAVRVEVTGTDAAGNATTVRRTIKVR